MMMMMMMMMMVVMSHCDDDVDDKVDLSRERFSQIFVKGPVQLFMFQLVPDINNLDL